MPQCQKFEIQDASLASGAAYTPFTEANWCIVPHSIGLSSILVSNIITGARHCSIQVQTGAQIGVAFCAAKSCYRAALRQCVACCVGLVAPRATWRCYNYKPLTLVCTVWEYLSLSHVWRRSCATQCYTMLHNSCLEEERQLL